MTSTQFHSGGMRQNGLISISNIRSAERGRFICDGNVDRVRGMPVVRMSIPLHIILTRTA